MMRERDHITDGMKSVLRCRVLRAGGRRATAVCCALAVWFAMAAAGWERAGAQATSCGINEITFTSGAENRDPSVSGDGTRVAFSSTGNLTNQNADGNQEIFLYDAAAATITQVTVTTGGLNSGPSISGDGTRIAFMSSNDLTNQNADGNLEIFLYEAAEGIITQVTVTTDGFEDFRLSLSGDGTRIGFESSRDLTGENADGNYEVFLYDAAAGTIMQVTVTTEAANGLTSVSGDGTRIAFASTGNLTNQNADGNQEIFLYDAAASTIIQVTVTTGGLNSGPSISGDGRRIAFVSNRFAGGNPDGNFEIFLYDITTSGISQITDTTGGSNVFPSTSGNGTRIAFVSSRDLTNQNTDGNNEIFLYDAGAATITQVTDTTEGFNVEPAISGDGKRIAFASNRFANLGNADGNLEIFIAGCLSPGLPPPAASADLLVSLGVDKSSVKQGDLLTYTITVLNYGPNTARNVIVNDTLASGATFVGARANRGTFTAPPANQTGTVTWNVADMLNGDREAAQITITVILRGKGAISNTATVGSVTADPNPANNTASIATTVGSGGGGNGKK